ncbi:P-loop containing nucleoside triphosphate hydrolase protein [Jaminaea rosea]|uniref:P-loop containing nucleoside triphosphate hydrolase protein n=1 Tax=Jaminaea rosea TaxID=1569628 RepID=A0A316UP05_9BASI|nr:P-loop containing nucleoside triphosphate hydrolase protein [Jaminaea rosea]PWN26081.1 P-loop containing nucleoside triphosphate hydrolase protein [Jaminaea rosea]
MQRETQWGAESHIEQYDEPEEDDDELEALRAGEGTSSRPRFEENGLLGGQDDSGEQANISSRTVAPPMTIVIDNEEDEGASSEAGPSTRPLPTRSCEAAIPKYIPAGHFNAVSMDGHILRFERRRRLKGWKPPPPHFGDERSTGLLSRPVHQIIDAIKAQEAEAIVSASEAALVESVAPSASTSGPRQGDGKVWVERYRPKRFTELLGDERVHREVMGWLKEWDSCVFKRKAKRKFKDMPQTSSGLSAPAEYRDPYDRPQQRVLLISGAPGLGKTTLAHVLAKAAGYGVYELNASDSRTSGAVTDTIKMALESASLKDSRPTCLVVDEIDGATGGGGGFGFGGGGNDESRGFIKALVDLVEAGKGSAGPKGKGGKGSGGGKKRKHKPLLRPIICICNDLYAPALRPLRPHCRLIRFQKPTQNHLVSRLKSICEREAISATSRSLSLLAELTQGDIRSCLNALQMAKQKQPRKAMNSPLDLTESDIRDAGKDGSTSLSTVWSALFRTASPRERARKTQPHEGPALTRHLVSLVQSSGEHTRLLQGCFEHYPKLNFVDDGWWRIRSVLHWADFAMELQDKAFSGSMFELMGYVPYSFVRWNHLFANTVNPVPEWPRADYEERLKRQAFNEIALELHGTLPPTLRSLFGREAVVRELGPLLMRILTPDLRPVNQQIVKTDERETLQRLVTVMLDLNLDFVRDKTEEGQLVYRLEPPLEVFTSYDGKRSGSVNVGRYAVRQIVQREVEAERAKKARGAAAVASGAAGGAAGALAAYRKSDANAAGAVVKKQKVALDFFGRPVAPKAAKPSAAATSPALPAPILAARQAKDADTVTVRSAPPATKRLKVHYRHNEGYSNAVRQPIKMSALL